MCKNRHVEWRADDWAQVRYVKPIPLAKQTKCTVGALGWQRAIARRRSLPLECHFVLVQPAPMQADQVVLFASALMKHISDIKTQISFEQVQL